LTPTATIVDFLSRECKNDIHSKCQGRWQGLGLEIICSCECHKKKEQQALAEVGRPVSNAIASLSQEPTQDDD
jgi:hypothetical protein